MQTKTLRNAARIDTEARLMLGDKAFIDRHSVGFFLHQGQEATCVNSDLNDEVALQLKSGDEVSDSRSGLIIIEYYTRATPDGNVEAEFELPRQS